MSKLNHPPRSEQVCSNCYYARPYPPGGQACRRMPPTLEVGISGLWPRVRDTDWCGEWAAREET